LNQKQQIDSENLEGGKQRSKKESLLMKHQDKIPKATWTSPNFRNTFTCQTLLCKTSYKKEKLKKIKTKGDTKDPNAIKGQ
jgi:hypothetical protein